MPVCVLFLVYAEVAYLVDSVSVQLEGRGEPPATGAALSTPAERAQLRAALGTEQLPLHHPQQGPPHPLHRFYEVRRASYVTTGEVTGLLVTKGRGSAPRRMAENAGIAEQSSPALPAPEGDFRRARGVGRVSSKHLPGDLLQFGVLFSELGQSVLFVQRTRGIDFTLHGLKQTQLLLKASVHPGTQQIHV